MSVDIWCIGDLNYFVAVLNSLAMVAQSGLFEDLVRLGADHRHHGRHAASGVHGEPGWRPAPGPVYRRLGSVQADVRHHRHGVGLRHLFIAVDEGGQRALRRGFRGQRGVQGGP